MSISYHVVIPVPWLHKPLVVNFLFGVAVFAANIPAEFVGCWLRLACIQQSTPIISRRNGTIWIWPLRWTCVDSSSSRCSKSHICLALVFTLSICVCAWYSVVCYIFISWSNISRWSNSSWPAYCIRVHGKGHTHINTRTAHINYCLIGTHLHL